MFILSMGQPQIVNIIQDRVTHGGRAGPGGVREKDGTLTARTGGPVRSLAPRNTIWTYDNGWRKGHPGYPKAHQHPATFPYALAYDHVRTWSQPGDVVYDPLAGERDDAASGEGLEPAGVWDAKFMRRTVRLRPSG